MQNNSKYIPVASKMFPFHLLWLYQIKEKSVYTKVESSTKINLLVWMSLYLTFQYTPFSILTPLRNLHRYTQS